MTLPLTSETLAAAYDYLRTTPPFSKWNLPEADEIRFKVTRSRKWFARYQWDGKRHNIEVSSNAVGQTSTLFEKMADEMTHLHLEELGMDARGTPDTHSGAFRSLAEEACKIHGWDVRAFY